MADDEDHEQHAHAFGVQIPAGVVQAMFQDHSTARGRIEDRHNSAMRWLDSLDVEGLMALRYILASDADGAYGNSRFYDGMVVTLLRGKGVDPSTGEDPAAQLLRDGVAGPGDIPSTR